MLSRRTTEYLNCELYLKIVHTFLSTNSSPHGQGVISCFCKSFKSNICWLLWRVGSAGYSWFQRRLHWLCKLKDGMHLFFYTTCIIGDPLIALHILSLLVVSSIIQSYWPHVSVAITSVESFRTDIFGLRKNFVIKIRSRNSSPAPRTIVAGNKQICNKRILCEGQIHNLSKQLKGLNQTGTQSHVWRKIPRSDNEDVILGNDFRLCWGLSNHINIYL